MHRNRTFLTILLALSILALACSVQLADPTPTSPPVSHGPTFTQPPPNQPTFTDPAPADSATDTPIGPTFTPMPPTFTPISPTATWTIHPSITTTFTSEPCTPDSEYVSDITIADGKLFTPGDTFTKTWRIRNDGTCTWDSSYQWVQVENSGGMLTASPDVINLSGSTAPGDTLDISVSLTLSAAASAGTLYEARFQMRAPDGSLFGTHPFTLIYASVGSGICPISTAGTSVFIDPSAGYCFLYPNTFSISSGMGTNYVNGPPPPGGSEMVPHVGISYEGAGGQTSQQFANSKITAWQNPSHPPSTGNIVLDGADCWWALGLPGITGNKIFFVVHNNRGYIMTLMPVDPAHPGMTSDAEDMWDVVEPSFRWIDP